ncbi:MAG: heavy-metal-associated domain-containing protein, partial [Dehalococcoidia bacterium]|nr:heavy-metal-associated domain-containing protein [Dehalococcoidia bacterium]
MAEITYSVPGMYADHHVSAVLKALNELPGIGGVVASPMRKKVNIAYEPDKVPPEKLEAALAAAGYVAERTVG